MKTQETVEDEEILNYYAILGLSQPTSGRPRQYSNDELKAAYHRALLLHHPDKLPTSTSAGQSSRNHPGSHSDQSKQYSVDKIVQAFRTLSVPVLKIQHDHQLMLRQRDDKLAATGQATRGTHLGVETFDLDELDFSEDPGQWTRPCRCGDGDGYVLTEAELETECEQGEIFVACHGCSLFIRVLFGLADEHQAP